VICLRLLSMALNASPYAILRVGLWHGSQRRCWNGCFCPWWDACTPPA